MRKLAVCVAVFGALAFAACDGGNDGGDGSGRTAPAPTAVSCADAPGLRERAIADRRLRVESKSDQAKIVASNRAIFYASLAIIADLKCHVTLSEADAALKPAFDAARKAEGTRSFYERAVWWGEAGYIATQVIPMLMKQPPVPISK